MERRVVVTGAGSALASNLMAGIREADRSVTIVGCNADRFVLKKSSAHVNYLLPGSSRPEFGDALGALVAAERIDVVIPTTDFDVLAVGAVRGRLACSVFLPSDPTIRLCQDKYELTAFLRARDLAAPVTYPIASLIDVDEIWDRLGRPERAWCRIRSGTCSMGATPVGSAAQARAWIEYWGTMRGVPAHMFTLSEHLPGRDFACQSLWKNGALVLVKAFERLSYVGGPSRPSGVSSIAAVARSVRDARVARVCIDAVRAVDPQATGVFSIDLKADARGTPCVTEINAGRFFTMMRLLDVAGKHSMTHAYLRLALDEPLNIDDPLDGGEDLYVVRDVDTLPDIFSADELFEGIVEITGSDRKERSHAH
jgi:carbamoyl-phosphate synthase large subunit